MEIIGNICGWIAALATIFVFLSKKSKGVLLTKAATEVFWVLHFFFIGAYTGCATNGIGIWRDVSYTYLRPKNKKIVWIMPANVILLYAIVMILTWAGPISLLPMIGSSIDALGFFQKTSNRIRAFAIPSSILWLVYCVFNVSIPGIVCNTLGIISIVVGFIKDANNKEKTE